MEPLRALGDDGRLGGAVFRVAFEQAPVGAALVSLEGRILRGNAALQALVGGDGIVGRRLVDLVHPADRGATATAVAALLDGGAGAQTRDVRVLRPSMGAVPAALAVTLLRDGGGVPLGVLVHVDAAGGHAPPSAGAGESVDALTALPLRALVVDRLEQALRRAERDGTTIAVLCCDVDRLKRVNDALGHDAGDRVLVAVAERLGGALRARDTAGRTGGDEITVVCEVVGDPDDALRIAHRIQELVARPLSVSDHVLRPSLSIGIAVGGAGDDGAVLLRHADSALYQAKDLGPGHAVLYDASVAARTRQRLRLEDDLRGAAARGELRLHHQPVIDLGSGTRLGHEALVRWQHPARGLLQPGAFLDVAEESDLIVDVGSWVLRTACQEAVDKGYGHVAVNVSARQLERPDFRALVDVALTASGLDPSRLVLELTETSLLRATAATLADVEALADAGVRLAIDDFGTGYSSMTYLQRLPVALVKVDRSFVADITVDPRRRAITRAVLALGEALDIGVIAEGVETTEQASALRDMGCRYAQGFLFGRPAPLPDAVDPTA